MELYLAKADSFLSSVLQDCKADMNISLLWVFIFSYTMYLVDNLLLYDLVAILCHK